MPRSILERIFGGSDDAPPAKKTSKEAWAEEEARYKVLDNRRRALDDPNSPEGLDILDQQKQFDQNKVAEWKERWEKERADEASATLSSTEYGLSLLERLADERKAEYEQRYKEHREERRDSGRLEATSPESKRAAARASIDALISRIGDEESEKYYSSLDQLRAEIDWWEQGRESSPMDYPTKHKLESGRAHFNPREEILEAYKRHYGDQEPPGEIVELYMGPPQRPGMFAGGMAIPEEYLDDLPKSEDFPDVPTDDVLSESVPRPDSLNQEAMGITDMQSLDALREDEESEDAMIGYIIDNSLSVEEQAYLFTLLEKDDRLSMIFDKVVGTASEFTGSGAVEGPGSETSDSILARLSDGEYVLQAEAAKEIGEPALDRLNAVKSGELRKKVSSGGMLTLAMGGEVGLSAEVGALGISKEDPMDDDIKKLMLSSNRMPSVASKAIR